MTRESAQRLVSLLQAAGHAVDMVQVSLPGEPGRQVWGLRRPWRPESVPYVTVEDLPTAWYQVVADRA